MPSMMTSKSAKASKFESAQRNTYSPSPASEAIGTIIRKSVWSSISVHPFCPTFLHCHFTSGAAGKVSHVSIAAANLTSVSTSVHSR